MSISTSELIVGQRYLFHRIDDPEKGTESTFRGNFLRMNNRSIIFTLYNGKDFPLLETNRNTLHTMPLNWIIKFETLEDILRGKTVLAPDTLRIIDSYI